MKTLKILSFTIVIAFLCGVFSACQSDQNSETKFYVPIRRDSEYITKYEWNENNVKLRNDNGDVYLEYTFDNNGKKTSETQYYNGIILCKTRFDVWGNELSRTVYNDDGSLFYIVKQTADERGNITESATIKDDKTVEYSSTDYDDGSYEYSNINYTQDGDFFFKIRS